jgi:hypothetical protein
MRAREVIDVARDVFGKEPAILKVEARSAADGIEESGLDLTFFVEGDLYEAESRVISLLVEFMRRFPDLPVEFLVLPASIRLEPSGTLVFSRENQRDKVGSRRSPR